MAFNADGSGLVVSSWDGGLYAYELQVESNGFVSDGQGASNVTTPNNTPIFSCDMGLNDNVAYCGGADGVLRAWDVASNDFSEIGSHDNSIRVVKVEKDSNVIVTGGWDNAVHVWDPRSGNNPVISENVNGKVFAMDVRANTLVVGNSNREILIYDFANNMAPVSCFESPMKFQTRTMAIFGDESGVAIGSVEGRVAMEYFNELERDRSKKVQGQKSFVYKCHRHNNNNRQEVAYAVNDIQFMTSNTFCTCGSDGSIVLWNRSAKREITQLTTHKDKCPIYAARFANEMPCLAYSVSYDWSQGSDFVPNYNGMNCVYIHNLEDRHIVN
jgi:WD40 repeat protein